MYSVPITPILPPPATPTPEHKHAAERDWLVSSCVSKESSGAPGQCQMPSTKPRTQRPNYEPSMIVCGLTDG